MSEQYTTYVSGGTVGHIGHSVQGPERGPYDREDRRDGRNDRRGSDRRPAKIFISHSSKDEHHARALVDLLEHLGARRDSLFCSSVPGFGIPQGKDIYSYLREQFVSYALHVIFLLSDHYYASPICLSEMGATWAMQSRYTMILLPRFEYRDLHGPIGPGKIAIKLDADEYAIKGQIGELKTEIVDELGLNDIDGIPWERMRDEFIRRMKTAL